MKDLCVMVNCISSLVILGLVIAIMLKQHKCCQGSNEKYREYSGGFSGTSASSEWS